MSFRGSRGPPRADVGLQRGVLRSGFPFDFSIYFVFPNPHIEGGASPSPTGYRESPLHSDKGKGMYKILFLFLHFFDCEHNAQEKVSYFIYNIHSISLVFSFILWYNYMNINMSIFESYFTYRKDAPTCTARRKIYVFTL